MTSPNPMALEAADPKLLRHQCAYNGPCADNGDGCICSASELHRRAALPLPAAGEGLTPQAQIMALIQEALALAPDAGLYLKIEVGAAK